MVESCQTIPSRGGTALPDPPGPAPKRELTGAWVSPQDLVRDLAPPMTPAGEARFRQNKPKTTEQLWSGNDPFQYCDPLGFPRNLFAQAITGRGGMWFEPVPNRMFIFTTTESVARRLDRQPATPREGGREGLSGGQVLRILRVGHWDGDYTFVINATGLDPSTWLDEAAHPHTANAHFEERYTRMDRYDIHLTVTVDDPTYYTKPWKVMTANFYWMKDQDFEENFCVPSQAVAYRGKVAVPSGNDATSK